MMSELGVSPLTVRRAVKQLVAAGLIDARPGNGTFVADLRAPAAAGDFGWQSLALGAADVNDEALRALLAAPSPGAVNLGGGYLPDELQALPQLGAAMARVARRPGVWGRMPSQGVGPLRMWFAQQIGGGIGAHDVIVSPGSQAAISVVLRALVAPGASLLVESPTYVGAIIVARALRLSLVPVTTDAGGVVPEALAAAFERTGARVFYSQPTFANPSGATLAEARRAEVLDVVAKAGAFLVEDDWGRDFAIDAVPLPPLATADAKRSRRVPSFSDEVGRAGPADWRDRRERSGARAVTVGAYHRRLLHCRADPGSRARTRDVAGVAAPSEVVCAADCVRGATRSLARFRAELGPGSLPLVPGGGLHLWTRLPDRVVDVDIAARAHAAGVIVSAGRQWFPAEPTGFVSASVVRKPRHPTQ
jgi:DNA-binding transcriptional MocR family regulator